MNIPPMIHTFIIHVWYTHICAHYPYIHELIVCLHTYILSYNHYFVKMVHCLKLWIKTSYIDTLHNTLCHTCRHTTSLAPLSRRYKHFPVHVCVYAHACMNEGENRVYQVNQVGKLVHIEKNSVMTTLSHTCTCQHILNTSSQDHQLPA